MTRPRHQSKVGERGVDFSCPRCHVAGVKNSIPVWERTESGYICGKEKPWEVASRDDPARRSQESLTSGQPTRRCSPGWTCTVWSETFHKSDIHGAKDSSDGEVEAITTMCGGPRKEQYIWHTISNPAVFCLYTRSFYQLTVKFQNCDDHTLLQRARTGTKLHYTHGQWTASATAERQPDYACANIQTLATHAGFLHEIVTGDEKWVHYDYPKRRATYGYPGRASSSTAKPNIHGGKIMLCIWWDQLGVVYYELLQPNERITGEVYRRQLMRLNKRLIHEK
ncbi:hypothetical protein LAZ67_12003580 [Cordylochernes scorpioides]|uniref:Uncharacterized protein n=1 Tax=Cordylochernes scorpioides TaxID=51811 RepID=A0ABY6L4B9_9ARAC|nr:hypothetical protein LAZ67_12003580 [Cordylochernes scorpioides]